MKKLKVRWAVREEKAEREKFQRKRRTGMNV